MWKPCVPGGPPVRSTCASTLPSPASEKCTVPLAVWPLLGCSVAMAVGSFECAQPNARRIEARTVTSFFMAANNTSLRPARHSSSEGAWPASTEGLVIRRGCLLHSVGERRIGRDELRHLPNPGAFPSRQDDLLDQRRCVRTHRVCAEDSALVVTNKLDEAGGRPIDDGAIDVGHLGVVRPDFVADRATRLRFGHSDTRGLRIGVSRPWHVVVIDGRLAGKQHVAYELDGFVGRDVRELQSAVDI